MAPTRPARSKSAASAYVHDLKAVDAAVVMHVWDLRRMCRRQLREMFYLTDSNADKSIARLVHQRLLEKEIMPYRRSTRGRPVPMRTHEACPAVDRYLDGRTVLYTVGPRGIQLLQAMGVITQAPKYESLEEGAATGRHELAVVETWCELEDAMEQHKTEGYRMEWFGTRRTRQLIIPLRARSTDERRQNVWPDGFFRLRQDRGGSTVREESFFLEVDLGTENEVQFRMKLDSYLRWRDERDRLGYPTWELLPPMRAFPIVLIVAANDRRKLAIADYIARIDRPKVTFLTTSFDSLTKADVLDDAIWWNQDPQPAGAASRSGRYFSLEQRLVRPQR